MNKTIDVAYKRVYDKKWNFENGSMHEYTHGLHPYPAMMMPLIARAMLKEYGKGKNTVFLDPYVGSGTTIAEAQLYGVKLAYGFDLNPLAILIAKVKTQELNLNIIKRRFDQLEEFLLNVGTNYEIPSFSIRDSWFNEQNIHELAKIRKFIFDTTDKKARDFFKVCFSEVVRLVSKTRNGEFKLYRMTAKSLANFHPNAIELFINIVKRNIKILDDAKINYCTDIKLYFDNSKFVVTKYKLENKIDLIITSPPYGDSHTTVAYGQFSRLSNEWLGFEDARQVDANLMGGHKLSNATFNIPELDEAIVKIKNYDIDNNGDRYKSVISFYKDYFETIKSIAKTVKKGGYAIYVVGNRRVRNVELPTDVITYKFFEQLGFEHVVTHVRDIINKRMPSMASPSNRIGGQIPTMAHEYIVIMRKI